MRQALDLSFISEDRVLASKLLRRLTERTRHEGECLIWTGYCDKKGYGHIRSGSSRKDGVLLKVHRVAWAILKGPPPTDRELDHICRHRACWNVEHLSPSTTLENVMADGSVATAAINAAKTHCPQGHEYNQANTRYQKTTTGLGRICRACERTRKRLEYERRIGRPVWESSTHCKRGHEFTLANTYTYEHKGVIHRACKACKSLRKKTGDDERAARYRAWLAEYEKRK